MIGPFHSAFVFSLSWRERRGHALSSEEIFSNADNVDKTWLLHLPLWEHSIGLPDLYSIKSGCVTSKELGESCKIVVSYTSPKTLLGTWLSEKLLLHRSLTRSLRPCKFVAQLSNFQTADAIRPARCCFWRSGAQRGEDMRNCAIVFHAIALWQLPRDPSNGNLRTDRRDMKWNWLPLWHSVCHSANSCTGWMRYKRYSRRWLHVRISAISYA
jgi:hypothetical protein